MKMLNVLIYLIAARSLALMLSACQTEKEVIREEVVVTATPEPVVATTLGELIGDKG